MTVIILFSARDLLLTQLQYSYLVTIPMIFTFAIGNTIIKYREGFILHPTLGSQSPYIAASPTVSEPYPCLRSHTKALSVVGSAVQSYNLPLHASLFHRMEL